jgi:hypothetical protein
MRNAPLLLRWGEFAAPEPYTTACRNTTRLDGSL